MANRQRRRRRNSGPSNAVTLAMFALVILFAAVYEVSVHAPQLLIIPALLVVVTGLAILWFKFRRRIRSIFHLRTIHSLTALTPPDFERAVGELLKHLGYYNVQHTGSSGDLGADLMCTTPSGERAIVQCKRYNSRTIHSPDMQLFFGMMVHHGAQVGIYVTTSSFTSPALALARQHNIWAIDGPKLAEILEQMQKRQRPIPIQYQQ